LLLPCRFLSPARPTRLPPPAQLCPANARPWLPPTHLDRPIAESARKHCDEIDSPLPVGQAGQVVRDGGCEAITDTVNLYDAKTNLSKLVDRAAAGEEIVIAKAGKPKAKLVPYQPPRKKRRFGQNLLGITYIADDFDGPLPPELQKYFE
jgi:prevent-host-death family protein